MKKKPANPRELQKTNGRGNIRMIILNSTVIVDHMRPIKEVLHEEFFTFETCGLRQIRDDTLPGFGYHARSKFQGKAPTIYT